MSTLRNRVSLAVESLGDRIVPTFVPTVVPGPTGNELVLTGDASNDDAQIRDFGNGKVVVTANNGADSWSFGNVSAITVIAGEGNDDVRYDLVRSLQPGRQQYVSAFMGAPSGTTRPDDDLFIANLTSGIAIEKGARLQISVDGSRGNDTLVESAIDVTVRAGGWMKTNYNGRDGEDTISQYYSGRMDGSLALRSWGGAGRDLIREVMDFDAASTGITGALVYGGDDADNLSLYVYLAPGMTFDKLEIHGDDDGDPLNDTLNYNSPPVTAFY